MGTLITVTFENVTGLAKDRFVNTFAIGHDENLPDETMRQSMHTAIAGFYNVAHLGGENKLAWYMSQEISRTAGVHRIRSYDITGHLSGSAHGSPVYETPLSLDVAGTGSGFPGEVAAAVSLESHGRQTASVELSGPPVTRPMQRRTGRLYLGPLNENCATTTYPVRPNTVFRNVVLNAVNVTADTIDALRADVFWGVWSRKDGAIRQIRDAFMDDTFDTQRRRGVSATAKLRLGTVITPALAA